MMLEEKTPKQRLEVASCLRLAYRMPAVIRKVGVEKALQLVEGRKDLVLEVLDSGDFLRVYPWGEHQAEWDNSPDTVRRVLRELVVVADGQIQI